MPSDKPDSFQCGPFEVSRSPNIGLFVEKLNRLREAIDSCRILPGVGYDFSRGPNGTVLTIRPSHGQGQSSAAQGRHPFQLSFRTTKEKTTEFYVEDGIVGNNSVKTDGLTSWTNFISPARIYLEAKISDTKISSLSVKSQPVKDAMERITTQQGVQTFARISVGTIAPASAESKTLVVVQNITTDLLSPILCVNGVPAVLLTQE